MLKTILPDAARTPHQTKNQPLGTTPLRISSCLASSFIQLAKLTLSLAASTSSCSFNSGVIRILNCGDCPPLLDCDLELSLLTSGHLLN